MNKPAVCIATIRPESYQQWLAAWKDEFKREGVEVFTMVDADDQGAFAKVPGVMGPIYDHKIVAAELGDKAWIIPKRTSACKSFAIYKAWKAGCDPIMVLDDDCLPSDSGNWFNRHKINLKIEAYSHVYSTLQNGVRPRGMPYLPAMEVVLSHGGWGENPDVDATTSLINPPNGKTTLIKCDHVPTGALFPMSGMNLAFRREIAPLMYFGLQGPDWGVDRFDDIWCGFLAKKVLDYCGYAVWSGTPYVRHVKASDPFVNIVKEAPGYKMNVELYQWAMNSRLENGNDIVDSLNELASYLKAANRYEDQGREYWRKYADAIHEWLDLFEPEESFGI